MFKFDNKDTRTTGCENCSSRRNIKTFNPGYRVKYGRSFSLCFIGFYHLTESNQRGAVLQDTENFNKKQKLLLYLFKMAEVIHVCTETESTKLMNLSIQVYDNDQIWKK